MDIRVETGDLRKRIQDALKRAPSAGRTALTRAGAFHVREMARRFSPYGSGSAAGFGGSIQTRSGALRRSFGFTVEGGGEESRVVMFSGGTGYSRIQELGGTITPKRRRFLTVPLPRALTPAGVLKGGARLVKRGDGYYTADGQRTVLFTSKRGNSIIASVSGSGRSRKLTPLYVLRSSVRLRPRLGFVRTFRDKTEPFFQAELARAVKEVLP